MPSAGLPLSSTLPCTLPVPGAGLTFSTPVSGAAVPALEFAGAGREVLPLPAAELPAGALPPSPPQPVSAKAAAKQTQVSSFVINLIVVVSLLVDGRGPGRGLKKMPPALKRRGGRCRARRRAGRRRRTRRPPL